jgi:hypothetical protein
VQSDTVLGNDLLYYFAIVILGLAAALVLFGVLRAYATYTGRVLHGKLVLGGSAVVFLLVVLLGFNVAPERTFNMTVHARDQNGRPIKTGTLTLTVGQGLSIATLANGEGTFKEIPRRYWGDESHLTAAVPRYQLSEPNKEYELKAGVITVQLEPDDPLITTLVNIESATFLASDLLTTLASNAGGDVAVLPTVLAKFANARVSFPTPMEKVPLATAVEHIFNQLSLEPRYERRGAITYIGIKNE